MQTKKPLRMTDQRAFILEEVKRGLSHPTADEIFAKIRRKMPKISLATVYRNLEIMASRGLINKLEPGRLKMRFDHETHDHYHLTCTRCGRLENSTVASIDQALADFNHILKNLNEPGITGHRVEFVGLCKKCRTLKSHATKTENIA